MTVTIDGLTKDRMLSIEAASIVGGAVDGAGHLILTRHDGAPIDAGSVIGPQGPPYVNGVDTVSDQTIGGHKTLTQPLLLPLGTVALPAISFSSDPDTGIFKSPGPQLNVVVDGVTRLYVAATGIGVIGASAAASPIWAIGPAGQTANLVQIEIAGIGARFAVTNDGAARSISSASAFGGGAFGADMAAVGVGHYDADNGIIYPYQPIRANASLIIQSKGTGNITFRNGAPSNLFVIQSTGSSYFSGNPGTTHASNQVLGQSQIIGARGFAVSSDGMPFYGGVTSGISISISRTDPAMVVTNWSGDVVQFLSNAANPALVVKSNGRVEMGTGGGGVATNGVQITNSPNGGFASVQITSAWGAGQGGSPIRCNNAGGTIFEIDMFGRVCFPLASTQGPIWVTTASGGGSAVPTTCAGFLMVQINGTTYKLAGYNV